MWVLAAAPHTERANLLARAILIMLLDPTFLIEAG
jgi:hypothetical protein